MLLETAKAAAAVATAGAAHTNRLAAIVGDADPIIKFTLLVLVFFSVVSWAIIILKFLQLKSDGDKSQRFIKQFWQAKTLEAFMQRGNFIKGPALNIFKEGAGALKSGSGNDAQLMVRREIERAAESEVERFECYVPFLATTASATPFIGLFGTCWGILNAFFELSAAGSSSIQVVGPRISEALFATAIGLAAAIPAVIFYNYFTNKIRTLSRTIEQYAEDLVHRIDTEFFKRNVA